VGAVDQQQQQQQRKGATPAKTTVPPSTSTVVTDSRRSSTTSDKLASSKGNTAVIVVERNVLDRDRSSQVTPDWSRPPGRTVSRVPVRRRRPGRRSAGTPRRTRRRTTWNSRRRSVRVPVARRPAPGFLRSPPREIRLRRPTPEVTLPRVMHSNIISLSRWFICSFIFGNCVRNDAIIVSNGRGTVFTVFSFLYFLFKRNPPYW